VFFDLFMFDIQPKPKNLRHAEFQSSILGRELQIAGALVEDQQGVEGAIKKAKRYIDVILG
jgi:hypothetical protein